jgi:muramoyltetrapeptide carboxypeptidase
VLAKRLTEGSRVGVVAPSSPVTRETQGQLERGISFLQGLGLELVVGEHVFSTTLGYCASPEEKAADINEMFADDTIEGIVCAQGGVTANACLPHLSWPTISANPKVFTGISDITVLLNAIYAATGLVTFHGNDLLWGFGRNPTDYDHDAFVRTLMDGLPGSIEPNGERRTIRSGTCEGVALGGNLRCLLKLAGTPYLPDPAGAIIFLEAIDVTSETCDCMVHQLEQMGVFEAVAGAVVGHVDGLQAEAGVTRLEEVLRAVTAPRDFPILKVDDFGHNCPNTVLPIGARVRLDADRQTIEQIEPFIA